MISAILLAAGQSTRMNGVNKLIKITKGKPLIEHSIINILESSVDELIIVTGYQNNILEKVIKKYKKIKVIYNSQFESGMASSLKIGIKNLSKESKAFFVCLGDMPMINKKIYNELIKHANDAEVVIPTFKNQQGNPILFSITMKNQIMNINGDIGAKEILKKNNDKILNLPINDEAILMNYNTIENFDD